MRMLLPALLTASIAFAQPLRLHPENPHYFLFAGQPAVLVTSGEHYGAVLNRDFDYGRYLDTLRADHLNLTRTFSGSYREVSGNFEIAANTLAPAPGKFMAPWGQRDGKFDLTKWDEAYFARLKDFVAYAGRCGVVDAMVRKIVSELRGFDNLYYEICNEPYFQGVTLAWQEHIAAVIAQTEAGSAKKHLIAQNWANGSVPVDRPNPLVSLFNFHYSRPPASVALNRQLNRAIGTNETGFDGAADAAYRIQGWDFLMAGGALYNNLDYSFTVGHEDGTFTPPAATPGGGSAALRRQLRHLRAFFDEIQFWRMQPAAAGIVGGPEGASARALEEPGKLYAVYIHHGRVVKDGKPRFQVDGLAISRQLTLRLPRGTYTAKWRDTRTGLDVKVEKLEVTSPGQEARLTSPVYAEDIALVVRAEGASIR
jgi:hypothetical protein